MADTPDPEAEDRDRVAIPLSPVEALRALLAVDPESEPVDAGEDDQAEPAERASEDA